MFEVTPEEIQQLDDKQLRELIGRLCEAELTLQGLSSVYATWGGHQLAADGGVDVRVELPAGGHIEGYIPRAVTLFQSKAEDMPPTAIKSEMCPADQLRPVIQTAMENGGAYILVSSKGSVADKPLQERKRAMCDCITKHLPHIADPQVDFYDRTRLASWVNNHPGVVAWVKTKVGLPLLGWQPFGPWANRQEADDAEYLLGDTLRLTRRGYGETDEARSMVEAMDQLRHELAIPGRAVRLVGLSGVGKTRLVQALFDARIGHRALPPSQVVYTDSESMPIPIPEHLAEYLAVRRTRTIMVVDNCSPELHRQLIRKSAVPDSQLSLLTIEYDVQEDLPEETQVFELEASSPELVAQLIARRHPHISSVDARTIAEVTGGNARLAFAIAGTINKKTGALAGLSDQQLFKRLFHQRHAENPELLRAAKVCSLVYSFDGETTEGEEAELTILAKLASMSFTTLYGHVRELQRRQLVQQRHIWRALLPELLANYLAKQALDDIPLAYFEAHLLQPANMRLIRSFSRRIGYLHDHAGAQHIARSWLKPGGLLGEVASLHRAWRPMLANIAPAIPAEVLDALESVRSNGMSTAAKVWQHYSTLLRLLAYDAQFFDRAATMLAVTAMHVQGNGSTEVVTRDFTSLYQPQSSGTYAPLDLRLAVLEKLHHSYPIQSKGMVIRALEKLLTTHHVLSHNNFKFGLQKRDQGYSVVTQEDKEAWYGRTLQWLEEAVISGKIARDDITSIFQRTFIGLWFSAKVIPQLEHTFIRLAGGHFWPQGWSICKKYSNYQHPNTHDGNLRLKILEKELAPKTLVDEVIGWVNFGVEHRSSRTEKEGVSLMMAEIDYQSRISDLAARIENDPASFKVLIPYILKGGRRVISFARELAKAAADKRALWCHLVEQYAANKPVNRNISTLRGYLDGVWQFDPNLAHAMLDEAAMHPALAPEILALHYAFQLDKRGLNRLKDALKSGHTSIDAFSDNFPATTHLAGKDLRDFILELLSHSTGCDIAVKILAAHFPEEEVGIRLFEPALVVVGQTVLQHVAFRDYSAEENYEIGLIAQACLPGKAGEKASRSLTRRVKIAIAQNSIYDGNFSSIMHAALKHHPEATLDILFGKDESTHYIGLSALDYDTSYQNPPARSIPTAALIDWCNKRSAVRYPLAATFIPIIDLDSDLFQPSWSGHALAIVRNAPDKTVILDNLIERMKEIHVLSSPLSPAIKFDLIFEQLNESIPAELASYLMKAQRHFHNELAIIQKKHGEKLARAMSSFEPDV